MAGQTSVSGAASVVLYRAWDYIIITDVHMRTVKTAIPVRRQWKLVKSIGLAVA